MILIAEIGNNHFGNFSRAKEMIVAAHEAGADMVKLQAFEAKDLYRGSMQKEFYDQCAFSLAQYKELIDFGRENRIQIFYSIFSDSLRVLEYAQEWKKISGKQTVGLIESEKFFDYAKTFVSFPASYLFHAHQLVNAVPLYVTPHLPSDPELFRLDYLRRLRGGKTFGYSDHTAGIDACRLAAREYHAHVIEKHFTVEKNLDFRGRVFRDTIHAATPKEFRQLAKQIKVKV